MCFLISCVYFHACLCVPYLGFLWCLGRRLRLCLFVFISVFLFTGGSLLYFVSGFRVVLGSCVSDAMTANQ